MTGYSEHRPTAAIISNQAIRYNIQVIQDMLHDNQQLFAVVKADAYGHGAVEVSRIAQEEGVDGLAVATVDEAIELRQAGIELPILVVGLSDPRGIAEVLHYDITITVADLSYFEIAYHQLLSAHQEHLLTEHALTVHLGLDTGMGRIGLNSKEAIMDFIQGIQAYDWVDWQGVFTHFATASGDNEAYMNHQWQLWQEWLALIPESVTTRHFANSAMTFRPEMAQHSDLIRAGIALYGLDSDDVFPAPHDLQPALSLVSEIIYVKQIQAGMSVSYGASYTAQETEWVATIPIGYADGWLRHYQRLPILVNGHACPVIGVINMDQLMIKLPDYYPVGTTVTLIGQDGKLNNAVSHMAPSVGTIGYEMLTSLADRIPRVYLEETQP